MKDGLVLSEDTVVDNVAGGIRYNVRARRCRSYVLVTVGSLVRVCCACDGVGAIE